MQRFMNHLDELAGLDMHLVRVPPARVVTMAGQGGRVMAFLRAITGRGTGAMCSGTAAHTAMPFPPSPDDPDDVRPPTP